MKKRALNTSTDPITRRLLLCGLVSAPLFIVTFLFEGVLRADYDPLRHPVSSLSIGEFGWVQMVNFVVLAALLCAFAIGLRRTLSGTDGSKFGPALMAFIAIGFLGAGLFVADPLSGYPLGTPGIPLERTTVGVLHDIFSAFFFLGFPILAFVLARMFRRQGNASWTWYSRINAIAMFVAFALAGQGFKQNAMFVAYGGFWQRVSIILALSYFSILAWYFLRKTPNRVVQN